FPASANRVGDLGIGATHEQETAAAAAGVAGIVEAGGVPDKGNAALDVEQRAIGPAGPAEATSDHTIGIADAAGVDAVRKREAGQRRVDVLTRAVQVQVTGFTFDTHHEVAAGLLPVVADRAAANEAAAEAVRGVEAGAVVEDASNAT